MLHSESARWLRWSCAGALTFTFMAGCDGARGPTEVVNAAISTWLQVVTETTGGDLDPDGYDLYVGAQHVSRLPANGTKLVRVEPGMRELRLQHIGGNCTLEGSPSRTVTVDPGATELIAFSVVCYVVGMSVVSRTTGEDLPPDFQGYEVRVGDRSVRSIRANDSVTITRQPEGRQEVVLSRIPDNCTTSGDNPRIVQLQRGSLPRLVFELACTRTNKRIAFVADDVIMTSDVNGSGKVAHVRGGRPSWSPDGTRILYGAERCENSWYYGEYCFNDGLTLLSVDSRAITKIEQGKNGSDPAWSRDGSTIAYREDGRLRIMKLDGGAPVEVSGTEFLDVRKPSWSPDGRQIVFGCTLAGAKEICRINSDGTGFQQLTSNAVVDSSPDWSPDGRTIAYSTRNGESLSIALMAPDGTNVRHIALGSDPSWIPDGSRLIFAGGDGLFTVRPDGSELTRITSGIHHSPSWRP